VNACPSRCILLSMRSWTDFSNLRIIHLLRLRLFLSLSSKMRLQSPMTAHGPTQVFLALLISSRNLI
jgi:hypothetical protein